MTLRARLIPSVFLLCAGLGIGCSSTPEAGVRRFQLVGVVTGHEASPPRVVIEHEEVKGLMPAMSMAFDVSSGEPSLRMGDRVRATLVVTDTRSWLENVRVTAGDMTRGTSRSLSAVPGTPLPDFRLIDQNNQPLTGRSFAGRVLVVTFIYTRCPLPDFCPLMVSHLERLRRHVDDRGAGANVALLAITLDPAYDSPAVLRAYGESVLKGTDRFDQWTLATGSATQIEMLAKFFGVEYRQESGLVTHTLATGVIGKDGRLVRLLPSNSWSPADLIRVVEQGIETPPEAPGE